MLDDPLAEIARIRARLAELEATAAPPPTGPKTLGEAIAERVAAPSTPEQRRQALESAAHGWQPSNGMEQALRMRAAMGEVPYYAEMRRVGADVGLGLALYERGREAAIALGTFVPTTEGAPK